MQVFIARTCAGILALAIVLTGARALPITPRDRQFVSAKYGVGVEAPAGWTLSTHTGYPSILVLILHPDESRISLAVSETPAKDARQLAELNRKGLEAQKLHVLDVTPGPRDGVLVTARAPARDESLVQLYLVRPIAGGARQAIVITLIARTELVPIHRPDLDSVISKLTLDPIEPVVVATPAARPVATPGARPVAIPAARPVATPGARPGSARGDQDAGTDSAGERPAEKARR